MYTYVVFSNTTGHKRCMKQWLPHLLLDYWAALMLNGFYDPDESAINLDHVHVCFRPCVHLPRGYLVDSDCIHLLVLKAILLPTLQCKATELLYAPIDSNISLQGMHQLSMVIITV